MKSRLDNTPVFKGFRKIAGIVVIFALGVGVTGCESTPASNTNQTSPSVTRNTVTPAPIPSLKASGIITSQLNSIHMENAMDGWAVARSKSQTFILRTSDGGQRFSEMFGVRAPADTTEVFFLNAKSAWISRTELHSVPGKTHTLVDVYRTANGGVSWKGVRVATRYRGMIWGSELDFLTATLGYILAQSPVTQDGKPLSSVELMRTTDGGETWKEIATSKQGLPRPINSHYIGPLPHNGIFHFVAENRGWISGNPGSNLLRKLYETTDGGRSWKQVHLPIPWSSTNSDNNSNSQLSIDTSTFTSGGSHGILPVALSALSSQLNSSQPTNLYQTSNAGHSWSYLGALPPNAVRTQFVNAEYGFSASDKGLFKTVDGGRNWKSISSSKQLFTRLSNNFSIGTLDFVTPKVGWILWRPHAGKGTRDKLYETTNGGQDWKELNPKLVSK